MTGEGPEYWLARRLGDRTLFAAGITTPEQRRELLRQRIISDGRQNDVAGRRASDGKPETYAELFSRLFGEPL